MKPITLIAVVLLTGCASEHLTQEHLTQEQLRQRNVERETRILLEDKKAFDAQFTPTQRDKDMNVCKYEAVKATGSSQRGYTVYSTIFNDMGDTFRQAEIIGLCMKAKGYAN